MDSEIVSAGQLTDMLRAALDKSGRDVRDVRVPDAELAGDGKTICRGTAQYRPIPNGTDDVYNHHIDFDFEVNAATASEGIFYFGDLEVVMEF